MSHERKIPELKLDDLNNISLKLEGPAQFDVLTVFIKDPENPDIYWFRKLGIKPGSADLGDNKAVEYFDVILYPMGEYDRRPIRKQHLFQVRDIMSKQEKMLGAAADPKLKAMQGVVGIADYTDRKDLTMEKMIQLVEYKFGLLRREFPRDKRN